MFSLLVSILTHQWIKRNWSVDRKCILYIQKAMAKTKNGIIQMWCVWQRDQFTEIKIRYYESIDRSIDRSIMKATNKEWFSRYTVVVQYERFSQSIFVYRFRLFVLLDENLISLMKKKEEEMKWNEMKTNKSIYRQ